MRITVVDLPADSGGALSILEDLYRFACEQGQAHVWEFVVGVAELPPSPAHVRVARYPQVKRGWLTRLAFETCTLPGVLRATRPDVILSLQNLAVPAGRVPQVVYVHQPLPFLKDVRRYSFLRRGEARYAFYQHIYGRWILRGVRGSAACIAQTESMRNAIASQGGIPAERITVVPPSINVQGLPLATFREGMPVHSRRFIYPAAYYSYKNHACLVAAAKLLVQRGIDNFEVLLTLDPALRGELGAADLAQVELTGYLARQELMRMLCDAVLVFPAYIESHPMPLAETRRLGGVILAAETPFGRELLAGYENAYFFAPDNPMQLADWMQRVLTGQTIYHTPSAPPPHDSSWARVLSVLENVAKNA